MTEIILLLLVVLHIEVVLGLWLLFRRGVNRKQAVYIDTSVLMDGRIVAIKKAGFVPDSLYIPSSVLKELQLVADGSDSEKRARARHGLDVAAQLTQDGAKVFDDHAKAGVDDTLLRLASESNGKICTIDYNLNKVATAQGIAVLNVHELAQQLRASHLPGERVSLKVTQKGSDSHQGVGHMADGTMVVIDNASSDLNKTIAIEFVRSIQTAAGRMLFAKKVDAPSQKSRTNTRVQKVSTPPKNRRKKTAEDSLISLVENQ